MSCYYNTGDLSTTIYFLIKTERDKLVVSTDSQRAASVSTPILIYRHLKVNSVEYEEESLYDNQNRYEFSKSLTFDVDGHFPPDRLFNQYSVCIEIKNVGKFIVNYDSMFDIETTFNGYTTNVVLTVLSNFPLMPLNVNSENTSRTIYSVPCGYSIADWKGSVLKVADSGTGRLPRTITDFTVESLEVHYKDGQVQTTLNVLLPIYEKNSNQYWNYIEYFPTNMKDVTLSNKRYEIKWESMLPTYNINGASATLTFAKIENKYPEINTL